MTIYPEMSSAYDTINPDTYTTHQDTYTTHHDPGDFNDKQEIKDVEKIAQLTQKIIKGQKRTNNLRVFERVVNLLASGTITGIMGYTLDRLIVTQNEKVNGTGPFGTNPKLWPTYVLTGVGAATFLFNLAVLLAYCCGRRAADKVASGQTYVRLLSPIGHLIVWGTTAGSFNLASNGKDIWGFSCSDQPADVVIQQQFEKLINYDTLCKSNTISAYTSIGTAGFAAIGVIIWIVITVHTRGQARAQKKLDAARRFEGYRNSGPAPYESNVKAFGR
ncbi:hypothetical protein Dda_8513 [Drechslerella dactyloides]|uniref:Uncharacterized protein n=1 Tax=Drechslerella dactyloides TaxID=74499 RepID=A0AAD6IQM5_DREDA|nr:hypothetical protein Dda_8513 [Drechslerella dactyloides]